MVFVSAVGDIKVTARSTDEDSIKYILRWIGFTTEDQKDRIYNDSIYYFGDTSMFTGKYCYDISTDFGRRTEDNWKINLVMRITKRIKSLLHWVQYIFTVFQDVLPSLI